MLRMVSLGSYSCSAVSVPSPKKTLYPQILRRHFSPSKWGITLAHFLREEAETRYSSVISFCLKENHSSDC